MKPLWYEAHNVERSLKKSVLPKTPRGLELLRAVEDIERRCCDRATLVLVCSEEDRTELAASYKVPQEKFRVVPNGVDTELIPFISRTESARARKSLSLDSHYIAIFIGSWHPPNLNAIDVIMDLARQCPTVDFLILGSSCAAYEGAIRPANVGLLGEVDDETKKVVLSVAEVALNPMRSGSGTNLKMLEYAAAGIPILTTAIGTRGLEFDRQAELFIAEIDKFAEALEKVRRLPQSALEEMTSRAKKRTQTEFDWRNIAARFCSAPDPIKH